MKIKSALAVILSSFLALTIGVAPSFALADPVVQSYSTAWNETPTAAGFVELSNGKLLFVSVVGIGDVQNGQSAKLVASVTGTDETKFDQSLVIAEGDFGYQVYAVERLADSTLVVLYKSDRYVRHSLKSKVSYLTSTDDGATWSNPVELGQFDASTGDYNLFKGSAASFKLRQDSAGRVYVFGMYFGVSVVGYWRTDSIATPNWTLQVADEYSDEDFGIIGLNNYFGFESTWIDDKLSILSGNSNGKYAQVAEMVYGNYQTRASFQSQTVILQAGGKSAYTAISSTPAGNRLAAVMYIDSKKKLQLAYRVYSASSKSWSTKTIKSLGASTGITLNGFSAYLAPNGDIAVSYYKAATKKSQKRWMRSLTAAGTLSLPIDISSTLVAADNEYYTSIDYLGASSFRTVSWKATIDAQTQTLTNGEVTIKEGEIGSMQTKSASCSAPAGLYLDTVYCINNKPGNGIMNETEDPNVIELVRLFFTSNN